MSVSAEHEANFKIITSMFPSLNIYEKEERSLEKVLNKSVSSYHPGETFLVDQWLKYCRRLCYHAVTGSISVRNIAFLKERIEALYVFCQVNKREYPREDCLYALKTLASSNENSLFIPVSDKELSLLDEFLMIHEHLVSTANDDLVSSLPRWYSDLSARGFDSFLERNDIAHIVSRHLQFLISITEILSQLKEKRILASLCHCFYLEDNPYFDQEETENLVYLVENTALNTGFSDYQKNIEANTGTKPSPKDYDQWYSEIKNRTDEMRVSIQTTFDPTLRGPLRMLAAGADKQALTRLRERNFAESRRLLTLPWRWTAGAEEVKRRPPPLTLE